MRDLHLRISSYVVQAGLVLYIEDLHHLQHLYRNLTCGYKNTDMRVALRDININHAIQERAITQALYKFLTVVPIQETYSREVQHIYRKGIEKLRSR